MHWIRSVHHEGTLLDVSISTFQTTISLVTFYTTRQQVLHNEKYFETSPVLIPNSPDIRVGMQQI